MPLDPSKQDLVGSFFMIRFGRRITGDVPGSGLIYVRNECMELYQKFLDEIDKNKNIRKLYIGNPGISKSLTANPDKKNYKEYMKVSGGCEVFCGRLWSTEELKECWKHAHADAELAWGVVMQHIDIVGPIPRLVFRAPEIFKTVERDVRSKLRHSQDMLLLLSRIPWHDLDSKQGLPMLVHLDRNGDVSWKCSRKIASKFAKEQLLLRLEKQHWTEVVNQRGKRILTDFRATLVELLMHLTFPKHFVGFERISYCDKHVSDEGSASELLEAGKMDGLHVILYCNIAELQEKLEMCVSHGHAAAYFWSRTKSEAAIDSLYVNFSTKRAYLLQANVCNMDQVVSWHALKSLAALIGIDVRGLYFIVPGSDWKKTRKVESAKPSPNICQYKVHFDLPDDDLQKIHSLRDYVDKHSHYVDNINYKS
ncbi:hypothetical protein SELMODRAFT_428923 [Selaginella moellendorffii]|uniref:Uncharacterized protein n=1 Tax=Selaginella moellendorffii TaxID=88036 RepID=D8T4G1_SELML|nr:hypothetical protein SELMODRAFT_428923 [Selaginella moellendorffii]